MNERIHELAKQAEQAADAATYAYDDDTGKWQKIWNEVYDEKFARLVIEHCISIVEPSEYHRAYANDYIAGVEGLELLDAVTRKLKRLLHD